MSNSILQVLLVDDDPACLEELRRNLATFPYIAVAGVAQDTSAAVQLLQCKPMDLALLDIELGGDSGFRLAKYIHITFPKCKVIFLTGHLDFALEGYEYGPVDFLMKPINLPRLERALLRVREQQMLLRKDEEVRIGIQSGNRLEIVNVQKTLYMEKKGRQVVLFCEGGEEITIRETLQKLEPVFQPHGFYRCHQSFLVSIRRIRSIQLEESKRTYFLLLEGIDTRIPLSRDKVYELRHVLAENGLAIC